MIYLCTEEKGHYEPIDEYDNWDYIVDEKKSKQTDSVMDAFNCAMEFLKTHPNAELNDAYDVHGFYIDDRINIPNTPTYCFYVEIVRK